MCENGNGKASSTVAAAHEALEEVRLATGNVIKGLTAVQLALPTDKRGRPHKPVKEAHELLGSLLLPLRRSQCALTLEVAALEETELAATPARPSAEMPRSRRMNSNGQTIRV